MSKEEKILALQLILEDIRGNWGWDLEPRVDTAEDIAKQLLEEDKIYKKMLDSIDEFREDMYTQDCDGRYFRTSFPEGYEGMSELHGLNTTYNDKSDEFKRVIDVLTYPENRFDDWERR